MNKIEQEVRMLQSGIFGNKIDLQSLVRDDVVSVEGANAYLASIGSSEKVIVNDNEVVNESGIRAMV